jgi:small conductance mechanosensitive channel
MIIFDKIFELLRPFYTKIVVAIIILFLGLIAGKLISRLIKKVLLEVELNNIVKNATGLNLRLESLISLFVKYFIYFIFFIWALERAGLGSIVLNILAGGVIIIIIISLILSIKDFVPNIISGLFINLKGMIQEGDVIKLDNVEGKIIKVDLIETSIETKKKDIIYIPNSVLIKNKIIKINKK